MIPLAQEVVNALLQLSMLREQRYPASPWVFTLDGSRALSKSTMRHAWDRACKAASVKLRLHGMRHTAITNMRAVGVPEGVAMAITGHKTRAVFDRYGIQPEHQLHEAIRQLEKFRKGTNQAQPAEDEPPANKPN